MSNKEFKIEQLEKIMANDLVSGNKVKIDKHGFTRTFEFNALGNEYKIDCYINQSTLTCGELKVFFFSVELSNTYPSHPLTEMKLQFRDYSGNCVATIPVKYWKEVK